jgi:hypothetical protein
MNLSARRLLNLVYYVFRSGVEHDEKKLREFEDSLKKGTNVDGTPAFWKGDDDAARSSMAVAAQLGMRPRTV